MALSVFSSRFVPSFYANLYRICRREINEINQTLSVEIVNYVDDIGSLDWLRWEGEKHVWDGEKHFVIITSDPLKTDWRTGREVELVEKILDRFSR